MPFKEAESLSKINRVVFVHNGQKLVVKYNSGEKYAEMQEKWGDVTDDEVNKMSVAEKKEMFADQACSVIEEWDYELPDGSILPIDGKELAKRGQPIEFYIGLVQAIAEDHNSGGSGSKKR